MNHREIVEMDGTQKAPHSFILYNRNGWEMNNSRNNNRDRRTLNQFNIVVQKAENSTNTDSIDENEPNSNAKGRGKVEAIKVKGHI